MRSVCLMMLVAWSAAGQEQTPAPQAPAQRSQSQRATESVQQQTDSPRQVNEPPRQPGGGNRQANAGAQGNVATAEHVDETPVVTHHAITSGGVKLSYTATVGQMPIQDRNGETEAHIFYVAYTLDNAGDRSKRPLTFAFNGGPGSASLWVHMGAMGPRRANLLDNGDMPPPPYKIVDNEATWLTDTDLVFIDPVGTGFSRAKNNEVARRMNSLVGDLHSVGEFVRMYLTRSERWTSPLFIAGESYGTTRAAGLAGYLIDEGIAFNGIALISTVLNFETLSPGVGNDLPYPLHLPTYTADAFYHKKLPPDLQKDLKTTLAEVEKWARTEYSAALERGDALPPAERKAVIAKLARYTGLDPRYIDESDLRIDVAHFTRELLRDQKLTIGRLDGRLTGPSPINAGERAQFDPSSTLTRPPFQAAFLEYLRGELNYKTDMTYYVAGGIMPWDWGVQNRYADTSDLLRNAFAKNPHMKVMVAAAYYDLATPFFAAEYTFNHMGLHPQSHKNIRWEWYEAGHMMYIDRNQRGKLRRDYVRFLHDATSGDTGQDTTSAGGR